MAEDSRRRILRMVADGTITAEEGADLLDALQEERRTPEPDSMDTMQEDVRRPATAAIASAPRAAAGRSLVIRVEEGDQSKVNLRIPLGLARTAGKFIPRRAQHDLSEHGIDLATMVEGIADGVEGGPLLQIEDGQDRIYIGVE
jgi:hypothetical protein